jgi:hypothetical protein
MKTNALITRKTPFYFLFGLLGAVVTSCGSYQNSSYYDNDGIYATNGEKVVIKDNQPNSTSLQYKQYFNSLQNDNSGEIFTDVNSYGNNYDTENDSIQAPSTGYASWGSSPQETTITVYPDSYWSIGFGFGWGYPYYGYGYGYPYYGYGWGYPYYGYGWGYPGYGYGYPGYGYPGYGYGVATPYAYNYSRRGSSYGGSYNNYSRNNSYTRNGITSRNSSYTRNGVTGRNSSYSRNGVTSRNTPTFTNRNSTTSSRSYTQNQSRSSYSQGRTNTSTQSSQRSYSAPSNNSYRSSGSSMSSGGGSRSSSGGGGGGSRSSGGRR